MVEEQGSKEANVFEEEVHIQPEVTAKKRGRPKKESIPSCLEQSPQKKKVLTGKLVKFTSRK